MNYFNDTLICYSVTVVFVPLDNANQYFIYILRLE